MKYFISFLLCHLSISASANNQQAKGYTMLKSKLFGLLVVSFFLGEAERADDSLVGQDLLIFSL